MADGIAIKVTDVSKTFKLPHERQVSVKSAFINFRRAKKGYEKQEALKDISFEVKEGDFFGIVGRNGGGKSTLLKLLAGIYAQDTGDIQVNGKLTPFIELGVGFNPELSGRENVFLNGALLGFNRKEMEAMYDSIVEFAEIERFMDQKLKNYSSGMQVRLAFSIAIRAQSDILMLDEVLAVGDAAFQQKCFNHFEELRKQRKTVVFVTHDMSAVRRFCNKAVYIKSGKLIASGSPAEIADLYIMENIEGANDTKHPENQLSKNHTLTFEKSKQTDKGVTLDFTYASNDGEEMYVGISVLKDGVPIAEISTPDSKKLIGKGKVSYFFDTSILNGGVYEITSVLCRWSNRQLLNIPPKSVTFTVERQDVTKGGALRLEDTWKIA